MESTLTIVFLGKEDLFLLSLPLSLVGLYVQAATFPNDDVLYTARLLDTDTINFRAVVNCTTTTSSSSIMLLLPPAASQESSQSF